MSDPSQPFHHIPVLGQELLQGVAVHQGGQYLDATVGGGGHSELILQVESTQVIALDQDMQALAAAQQRLQGYGDRIQFQHCNFAAYDPDDTRFDGIIADLGVSSAQLDQPQRGFSFRNEAPLDMRMNQQQPLTAAELVNQSAEKDLADLFYHYGEERFSRRIARHLVQHRPFRTTTELATAVTKARPRPPQSGRRRQGIHPATRVFQALRIAVNQELQALEDLLEMAPTWLKPGGRIGIISFHSLEDRRVKHQFRSHPLLKVLTKKPIGALSQELEGNPRSRSAKLRVAERITPEV